MLCYTVGKNLLIENDECFATTQLLCHWQNTFITIYRLFWHLADYHTICSEMTDIPGQVRLCWLLGATSEAQDLGHICKGTAISRLGDEDSTAHKKDQEGHPKAHSGNYIALLEADILLDVGHTSQRQYGP